MQADLETVAIPSSLDAEKAVLGGILLDNDAYAEASVSLVAEDFYLSVHRTIYQRMSEMLERHRIVDLVTLQTRLRETKELEGIGGTSYLSSLTEGLPHRLSIGSWVRIVKDKSLLREIMAAGTDAALQAADEQDAPLDVLNALESKILSISQKSAGSGLCRTADIMRNSFRSVDDFFQGKQDITGISTHYPDIDRKTCGLQRGELIIIAARPSMGKTSLAVNIAQRAATLSGKSVAVFSLEMSKEALLRRMISAQSMVDLRSVQTGNVPLKERSSIHEAMETLAEAPLFIDDTASISLSEMRAKAQRLKRSADGLDLILVDYLQLMSASHLGSRQRYENRTQEVSALSRGLKALAKELNVPVVALSQLSRENERRGGDKRPILSDLRESGSIEQDADVVAFIHRESYYNRDENGEEDHSTRNEAELIIMKQRNGPTGTVKLVYLPHLCAFEDLSMRLLAQEGWNSVA